MVKTRVLTPWFLLFLSANAGAAPTAIQPPLLDQGATVLAVQQSDDIKADGQTNVASTEVSLFGLILMREDLERLQQYASELEEDGILLGGSEHHSTAFGLHSMIAKIVDGKDASPEILHSASIKASALTPFSHRITKSAPDVVESETNANGDDQVLQDDARYSANDLLEDQSTANLQQLEQLITGFIRSHINYSRSEETEAAAEDAPSDL